MVERKARVWVYDGIAVAEIGNGSGEDTVQVVMGRVGRDSSVMEIGAGSGEGSTMRVRLDDEDLEVVHVDDVSDEIHDLVRRRLTERTQRIAFVVESPRSLDEVHRALRNAPTDQGPTVHVVGLGRAAEAT